MDHLCSPFGANVNKDLIGSATSVEEIIDALARRGCSNLTSSIDLTACRENPLAFGGFCDVFLGALYDNTKIAIKRLRVCDGPEAEVDGEGRKILKRAARELYHWSKLRHRNVLPLMGLAMFRGYISMVSEWMENGSLMSYLRINPGANRNKLCMDVCSGLCYIHTNDMVHGDLKGANVMVSSDGTAMIADFGNAQLKDLMYTLKFTGTTKRGISVRWAAPELLLEDYGPQVSKEADVYAYGMTVLEALTGQVPYEGISDNRVFGLVAYEKKFPPRPDIAICEDLWGILISCWAREPSERPGVSIIGQRLQTLFLGNKALPPQPSESPTFTSGPVSGNLVTDNQNQFVEDQPPSLGKAIDLHGPASHEGVEQSKLLGVKETEDKDRAAASVSEGHLPTGSDWSDSDWNKSRPSSPVPKIGGLVVNLVQADLLVVHRRYFLVHDHEGAPSTYCWGVFSDALDISQIYLVEWGSETRLQFCRSFDHMGAGLCVAAMGHFFLLPNSQDRALYRLAHTGRGYEPVTLYSDEIEARAAFCESYISHTSRNASSPASSSDLQGDARQQSGILSLSTAPPPMQSSLASLRNTPPESTGLGASASISELPCQVIGNERPDSQRTSPQLPELPYPTNTLGSPVFSQPPNACEDPPTDLLSSEAPWARSSGRFFKMHPRKGHIDEWVDRIAAERRATGKMGHSLIDCPEAGCSSSPRRPHALKTHIYGHYGIRPFKCEKCPSKFLTRDGLKKHTDNFHNRQQCDVVMSKSNLKTHKET